jgi:hypothetical protein
MEHRFGDKTRRDDRLSSHCVRAKNNVKKYGIVLLAVMGVLQTLKTVFLFRGVDIHQHTPLLTSDFVTYWARAFRTHQFMQLSGRSWGYDPFQMGGYPAIETGGILLNLVPHFLHNVLPLESTLLGMEIGFFLLLPLPGALAYFLWEKSLGKSMFFAAVLIYTYGWFEPFSKTYISVGALAFQMAVFACFLQVILFWKWTQTKTWLTWSFMTALSCLIFQLHPLSCLIVGFPCLALFIHAIPSMKRIDFLQLFLAIVLTISINLNWIVPYVFFKDWVSYTLFFRTGGWRQIVDTYKCVNVGGVVNSFFLLVMIVGLKHLFKQSLSKGLFFTGWLIWLGILGYFGSQLPWIKELQPVRFVLPFSLVVYALASMVLFDWVSHHRRFRWVLFGFSLIPLHSFYQHISAAPEKFLLSNQFPSTQKELIEFVKNNPTEGRYLIETTDEGPHFLDMLPNLTGQSIIGGPYAATYLATRITIFYTGQASLGRPIFFGRDLQTYPEQEFKHQLNLYHVTRVMAHSKAAQDYLRQFPKQLRLISTVGGYDCYDVLSPSSWFYRGKGKVQLGLDKIELSDLEGEDIIIKSHYLKTLRTDLPIQLEPFYVESWPLPFIRVNRPPGVLSVRIENGGIEQKKDTIYHRAHPF